MKDYFAKYLPVEGEIKEGDTAYNEGDGIHNFDKVNCHPAGCKKVKLFLCSRDIQVGDKVIDEKGCTYHIDGGNINSIGKTIQGYKIIGDISPDAIWVKEGDEFNEENIQILNGYYKDEMWFEFNIHQRQIVQRDEWKTNIINRIKIKCPTCKTFH